MKPTPNAIIPQYQGTLEDLNKLSRQELQELAQKHGVPASFKTATIIERLMKQVTPKNDSPNSSFVVDFSPIAPLNLSRRTEPPQPECFSLEGKKLTSHDLIQEIEQATIPQTTEKLLLAGNALFDEGIPVVISLFQFLHLTVLDLEGNSITDNGCAHLFEALFTNPILRSLSLAENLLFVCPLLPELLQNNHVMTVLNLSGNKVRDDTIRFIGPALKNNHGLVTLNLSDNELTNESLEVFNDVLEENQMLTTLSLQGNFIQPYESQSNIALRLEVNRENKFRWVREGRGEYASDPNVLVAGINDR